MFAAFTLALTVVEAGVVALLFRSFEVMRYVDAVQWWGVAVVLGILATATVYPHIMTSETIRIRRRGATFEIPLGMIDSVSWSPQRTKPEGDVLFLSGQDGTQLTLTLKEPHKVAGTANPVSQVLIAADDKSSVEVISSRLQPVSGEA